MKKISYTELVKFTTNTLKFAGLDEYWQSFIPGRLSSKFDMLADISGIIFGSVLTMWISREND